MIERHYVRLAEVTALPHDKPTLYRLVEGCGGMLPKREPSADDYYADHMSDDECRALMSTGVYYTNAELRAFLNALGQGDEADVIRASKVRGIFVSDTTAYVVYMAQPGDNKIIATRAFAEQRLLESLKAILSVTHVRRLIKHLIITVMTDSSCIHHPKLISVFSQRHNKLRKFVTSLAYLFTSFAPR